MIGREFLFVQSTTEQGGAETVLLNGFCSSTELRERGAIVTLGFGRGDLAHRLRHAGAEVFEVAGARLRRPLGAFRTVTAISRIAKQMGARVVVGNGSHPQVYGGLAARLSGARSVHFVHAILRRRLWTNHPIEALAISGPCDWALACSDAARKALVEIRPRLPTDVLHPGTVIASVPAGEAEAARTELGAGTRDVLIGVFGRLQWGKGQDVFIEAAARLAPSVPQARFVVVGGPVFGLEPEWEVRLKTLVRAKGLEGRVVFTGHRQDVQRLMAACDVVCQSSRLPESFGMVLVEAMAQAKPVVATACGGPSEIVVEGVTGFLVPPEDATAMAAALSCLAADGSLRHRLGEAALRRARERFSAEAFAERLLRQLEVVAAA